MALFTGTANADVITPGFVSPGVAIDPPGSNFDGNDTLRGLGGDDYLFGGDGGNDRLEGGAGNDTLDSDRFTDDTLLGGNGHDLLNVLASARAYGGAGNDTVAVFFGEDPTSILDGGDGIDLLSVSGSVILTDAKISNFERLGLQQFNAGERAIVLTSQLAQFDSIVALGGTTEAAIDLGGSGTATLSVDGRFDLLTLYRGGGTEVLTFNAGAQTSILYRDTPFIPPHLRFDGRGNITSGNGRDTLYGGDASDTLNGSGGHDQLFGEAGGDQLWGGLGNDLLDGSEGDDPQAADTMRGGEGNDTLLAYRNDRAFGEAGNDLIQLHGDTAGVLSGGGGTDRLRLMSDANVTNATVAGIERLILDGHKLQLGADQLGTFSMVEGPGALRLTQGGTASVQVVGPGFFGLDVQGSKAGESLTFQSGANVDISFQGGAGDGLISTGKGNDLLYGGGGNDTILAGSGIDLLIGGGGNDSLVGDAGADYLDGGAGNDTLLGGAATDTLIDGLGNDLVNGGDGIDTLDYQWAGLGVTVSLAVTTAQNTGVGLDRILNVENVVGSAFGDSITGSDAANELKGENGNDTLIGGRGHDTLYGGAGDDVLEGGAGNDWLIGEGHALSDRASYASAGAGVAVDLSIGIAQNTIGAGTDLLSGIDDLTGSRFNDTLSGNATYNRIEGGDGDDQLHAGTGGGHYQGQAGNDSLFGGTGIDVLNGGAGDDQLTGGASGDIFIFQPAGGSNVVTDFSGGDIMYILDFGPTYDTYAEVIAAASQVGLNTMINLDLPGTANDTVITLLNTSVGSLQPGDFYIA